MNLGINSYCQCRNNYSNKVAFRGDFNADKKEKKIYTASDLKYQIKEASQDATFRGLLIGAAIGTFTAMAIGNHVYNENETKRDEYINKIDSIIESDDIKKDTFMVKDCNKDSIPDFVLFNKDGSPVVLDMKNLQVLEQKTELKPVE